MTTLTGIERSALERATLAARAAAELGYASGSIVFKSSLSLA